MGCSENSAVLDPSREDQDAILVRRGLAGEESAFAELVARYQSYVYNVCLHMLGNAQDAEDAAQDVFVAVYKGLPGLRMQSKVLTWIYRITVNQCISRRRARQPEVNVEAELLERAEHSGDSEKRRLVRSLLQRLAPHYRAVLVLKYYQELSYDEAAEILGWSPEKVKCYLHRARGIFRQIYVDEMGGGVGP